MLARMQRKRISFALLVGMQAGAATVETVWKFLKKLKIELPYNPAIALLGIYPRDTGMLFPRGTCTPNVYSSTINKSQSVERAQISIDR